MKQTTHKKNPFPKTDPDRHAIWEILVRHDIDAYLAADWSQVDEEFSADLFVGYGGHFKSDPKEWTLEFPNLGSYRDYWYKHSRASLKMKLRDESLRDYLYRLVWLEHIEIKGDRALALKKFDGETRAVNGDKIKTKWQSLYFLRKINEAWKITGFVGYLPNPMPTG